MKKRINISLQDIITSCKKSGTKIVAGGSFFTAGYDDFNDVDHLVLNEADMTLPLFLMDLEQGRAKHLCIRWISFNI